ncbi:MAG TPA: STAS domain-containing protein [Planctomicrobium sp.]|nr:STAS domain-containing protein [Planctomicrobium sp.]
MQYLKIFKTETLGNVVVVAPQGEGSSFRYHELHLEANAIRGMLAKSDVQLLVIDLHEMSYFGSEFVGAIVSMLREMRARGGKSCFCRATPQVLQILKNMSLFKLWPHYESREEAIASLAAPPIPMPQVSRV